MAGHAKLVTPQNTTEFYTLVNTLRQHHRDMHGQVSDVAANLRSILPDVIRARGGTRSVLMGTDAKIAAYRVTKPLMDLAALNDNVARLYVLSYTRYTEYVVNIKNAKPKSTFNADV